MTAYTAIWALTLLFAVVITLLKTLYPVGMQNVGRMAILSRVYRGVCHPTAVVCQPVAVEKEKLRLDLQVEKYVTFT